MGERIYTTPHGEIHYWKNRFLKERKTLVLLPGLTADHHLFDQQVKAFAPNYNILTWDAPGHGTSRPFEQGFHLSDKAMWLHGIMEREGVRKPILIGQSMGGYVSQCFLEQYPGEAGGFVSIDSAPLKRQYVTWWEIWLLKRMEPVYRVYPWEALKKAGAEGCSTTAYGRKLMRHFVDSYSQEEYSILAGNGYRMLAEAMEEDLPYRIDCPAILICGTEDKAGSAKSYNRRWAKKEGIPIYWIEGAGHNSNTDRPEEVNGIIHRFVESINK